MNLKKILPIIDADCKWEGELLNATGRLTCAVGALLMVAPETLRPIREQSMPTDEQFQWLAEEYGLNLNAVEEIMRENDTWRTPAARRHHIRELLENYHRY